MTLIGSVDMLILEIASKNKNTNNISITVFNMSINHVILYNNKLSVHLMKQILGIGT